MIAAVSTPTMVTIIVVLAAGAAAEEGGETPWAYVRS